MTRSLSKGDLGGDDADLVSKVFAEGESGAANGAKHVAAVGDFFDAHLLAETDFTKLATSRALDVTDLEFATSRSLTEGQGGVTFEFGGENWHLSGRIVIETLSQFKLRLSEFCLFREKLVFFARIDDLEGVLF